MKDVKGQKSLKRCQIIFEQLPSIFVPQYQPTALTPVATVTEMGESRVGNMGADETPSAARNVEEVAEGLGQSQVLLLGYGVYWA